MVHIKIKNNIKISILILLIITLVGCELSENKVKSSEKKIAKYYGRLDMEMDSFAVELDVNKFEKWTDLVKYTEKIACNDSIPKMTIKSDLVTKTIHIHNDCWDNLAGVNIKKKNTIEIKNDVVYKNDNSYPLHELENVLKRDIRNNGENPKLLESQKRLVIYISYDDNSFENFKITLDKLTDAYERITNDTDIYILLEWINDLPILM